MPIPNLALQSCRVIGSRSEALGVFGALPGQQVAQTRKFRHMAARGCVPRTRF
jgi:hypothetical protein